MLRPLLAALFAALLVACSGTPAAQLPTPPPAAQQIADVGCGADPSEPEAALTRLTAAVLDSAAPPGRRAVAVHELACLVESRKRSDASIWLQILTLGVVNTGANEHVVDDAKLPPATDALSKALCDPANEVHDVAAIELDRISVSVAGPALARALKCDGPRAAAAAAGLEARVTAVLREHRNERDPYDGRKLRGDTWDAAMTTAKLLADAAHSDKPELAARAKAANVTLERAADALVAPWVRSADLALFGVSSREAEMPLVGPAFARALPALRERLTDPDYRVRLSAASAVWRLTGASPEARDALAAELWTGFRMMGPELDSAAGVKLRALVDEPASTSFHEVNLIDELGRLAKQGPAAAPAVDSIRACLSMPSLRVQQAAGAALVFIAQDRSMLPILRKGYKPFFRDSTMAYGAADDVVVRAILYLDPSDAAAQRALGLRGAPTLLDETRRAIQGNGDRWWLVALLRRDSAARPTP